MLNLPARMSCRRSIYVLLGFLVSFSVQALPPQLQEYRFAHELYQSTSQTDDYRLVLGAMEKVNGQWRPEKEQRLDGNLQRQTLLLNSGHNAVDAYDFYRQQLLALGARELFHCEARECGSSNSWANSVFNIKQLYGLEQTQRYSAFEWRTEQDVTRYLALYAVTRGNKRSYLQIDSLFSRSKEAIASSVEVMAQALREGRSIALPNVEFTSGELVVDEPYLTSLLALMSQRPTWRFNVVGHDAASGSTAGQLESSTELAQQLVNKLIALGVTPERLSAFGVGNLAPGTQLDLAKRSHRIELVKVNADGK